MNADDPRALRWRACVNAALRDTKMSRRQLAHNVGVSAQRMSQWIGPTLHVPPDPDTVFLIDDVLGAVCSTELGYVRSRPGTNEPVEQSILRDESLNKSGRDALLLMYRAVATAGRRNKEKGLP